MKGKVNRTQDDRIENVFNLIRKLAAGDLEARGTPSKVGDELDAIITGLNMLGEELLAHSIKRELLQEKEKEAAVTRMAVETIDAMGDGLVLLDMDAKIISVNPAFEELTGYGKSEMIGIDAYELIPKMLKPEEVERIAENFGTALKGEIPDSERHTIITKAGQEIPLISTISFINDNEGKPNIIVSTVKDITERKRVERELEQKMREMKIFVDNIPHLAWLKDTDSNFILANQAFGDAVGMDPEFLRSNTCAVCFGEETAKKFKNDDRIVMEGKKKITFEETILDKDENKVHLETTKSPIFGDTGDIVGTVGIAIDITERKWVEEALRKSEKRYRELFAGVPIGLFLTTPEGDFIDSNPALLNILDYSNLKTLMKRKTTDGYVDPNDGGRWQTLLEREGIVQGFETQVLKRDGTPIWVEMSGRTVKSPDGNILFYEGSMKNISERKKTELQIKKRLMKFKLENGNIYLVKEPVQALSIEAFNDLLKIGYKGLVISRTPETELKRVLKGDYEFLWLCRSVAEKVLLPDLDEIESRIKTLHGKKAVLIDRLDYLVSQNDFDKTLSFVQWLKDFTYFNGQIVILSIDTETLSKKELVLIEKETKEIEPRHIIRVPEELLTIMKFVYVQNNLGKKPAYSDVGRELGISKPTIGKRIKRLVNTDYLFEREMGRRKILELSEKGRKLFLK